ncbi:helix-turn-helix domain-containing protein [Helcococcus ovis]|uniref:helix-turn-helix domain-containing protein n=1 Tax=Helcococcus ovis TaxID=72026 RepID=UPI0038B9BE98
MGSKNIELKLLIDKNMKKQTYNMQLKNSKTIANTGKIKNVSLEILGKICEYFQYKIGDIIEYKH